MDMRIPPRRIKNMPESNPLKSSMLVRRLAVVYIHTCMQLDVHVYMFMHVYVYVYVYV